ncbi:hypothetical protein KQX54_007621 [Cotesia glomerata]|uniref:Uncharacterized protein n=1 Tax=Cotesia glomerata TaxID=32391 RepID=A0AAV7IT98_COTGL|nr:hypothetical protein KQX54_007621 [Cotesia glomerata]
MGSNDNTSKTTDNPSTQVERGTTEQIFKNLMKKFENFFKFNQNQTNEAVTITISENNVVLTTQSGTEYKADEIDKRLNNDSDFPKTTATGEEVRLKTTERENDPQRKNAKNESSSSSDLQNPMQVGGNDKLNDVLMKFCTAANSNTKHQSIKRPIIHSQN